MKQDSNIVKTAFETIESVLKVMFNSKRWEDRFGAITGSSLIVSHFSQDLTQTF
jgi:hypothetical protein